MPEGTSHPSVDPSASATLARSIAALTARNELENDTQVEHDLLRLRHERFLELARDSTARREEAPLPRADVSIDPVAALPVTRGIPDASVVRSAIESHGSLIVRDFLPADATALLKSAVETAVQARQDVIHGRVANGESPWYSEFPAVTQLGARSFTETSGALVVDSPRGAFQLIETFRALGIDRLAGDFLGTPPVLSAEKTVFRRVEPAPFASWHQDGAFLGETIRTLDVWIALSHCGKSARAPGLEILPRRVPRILPTGAFFSWDLDEREIAKAYPGFKTTLPSFAPGDAILFDQLCVHRSGHLPGMTDPRLAIECWLFGTDSVPEGYTGLAI